MIRTGITVREAAEKWVGEMNAIQQGMIERLMRESPDEWHEVTRPSAGDRVYAYEVPHDCSNYGEIVEYDHDEQKWNILLDTHETIAANENDFDVERDGYLPMWGTMWSFGDSCDDWWLEEDDGIQIMSDCGFRIYEHDEFGYFFGIDGAGYDFYESHWIPLYKARGLQWHDKATEDSDDQLEAKVRASFAKYNGDVETIIQKILSLVRGQSTKIGGYYGGFVSAETAAALEATGHYDVDEHSETVLEPYGRDENRYYVIMRTV